MTLQMLHSEFPYIYEDNFILFFISVVSKDTAGKETRLQSSKRRVRKKGEKRKGEAVNEGGEQRPEISGN
jgi:hypothetical protein